MTVGFSPCARPIFHNHVFPQPLSGKPGFALSSELESDLEKDAARGIVTFETQVLNQNHEPVIVYTDKLLVKRRP